MIVNGFGAQAPIVFTEEEAGVTDGVDPLLVGNAGSWLVTVGFGGVVLFALWRAFR